MLSRFVYIFVNLLCVPCSVILSSVERYMFSFQQVKRYRRRRTNIFIDGFLA